MKALAKQDKGFVLGKSCLVEIILFPAVHSHQTFNHSDVRLNEDLKLDVYDKRDNASNILQKIFGERKGDISNKNGNNFIHQYEAEEETRLWEPFGPS